MNQSNFVKSGLEENFFDVLRVTDLLVLFGTAVLAYYIRLGHVMMEESYLAITCLGTAIYFVIAHGVQSYKFRHFHYLLRQITLVFVATSGAILTCVLLLFMMKISGDFSRLWVGYWFLLTLGSLIISRFIALTWFRRKLAKGRFVRKVVLVGETIRAKNLLNRTNDPSRTNVEVVALYTPEGLEVETEINLPKITKIEHLAEFCAANHIDDVIICVTLANYQEKTDTLLADLRAMPCHVRFCLPSTLFDRGMSEHIWGAPVISIYRRPLEGRQLRMKRALDFSASGILLLLASPVLLGIVLALRLSGEKDILFKQQRNGFAGQPFEILKFRTMRVAEAGTGTVTQATKNDPRVTKIGSFLRKTSLDELPQLINVLRGDMSLVGPRPHASSHNDHYSNLIASYMGRNRMKPGITGWAQINGWRGETDTLDKMEGRVRYDLYYIEHWSIWLDIKVLLLTPLTLLSKNAY